MSNDVSNARPSKKTSISWAARVSSRNRRVGHRAGVDVDGCFVSSSQQKLIEIGIRQIRGKFGD